MIQNNPVDCVHPLPFRMDAKIKNDPFLLFCTECKCYFYEDDKFGSNGTITVKKEPPVRLSVTHMEIWHLDPDTIKDVHRYFTMDKNIFPGYVKPKRRWNYSDLLFPIATATLIFSLVYGMLRP